MMLLGQQAGAPAAEDAYQGNIPVERNRHRGTGEATYDDYSVNNVPAVTGRQADIKETEEASDRRGMFGMKGTLRDVIGLVGDAFLVQSGNRPMYAPQRQGERISDAWAGASEDPIAAAERVGYYDAGMGQDLLQEAQQTQLRQQQQQSLAEGRQSLAEDRDFKQYEKARLMIGGLLNTPGAVQDGQISPQALAQAGRIARSAGMTLEEFMLAEGMSEEDVRDYAMSVLDPYKQERLEDYDVGLQQGQQRADASTMNAQSSRIRANRPPAGRNPPQPTRASILADIMRKPASQRTAEEQAFITRETQPSSSSRTRAPRPLPGAKKVTTSNGRTFTVKEN
jgi:hypothetical protein